MGRYASWTLGAISTLFLAAGPAGAQPEGKKLPIALMDGIWDVAIKSTHFGEDGTKTSYSISALFEIDDDESAEGGNDVEIASFPSAFGTVLFPETFGQRFGDYFFTTSSEATIAGNLKVDSETSEATAFDATATLAAGDGVVVARLKGKRLASKTPASSLFLADFEASLFPYTETDPAGIPAATLWHAEGLCGPATAIPGSMGAGAAAYNQGDIGVFNFDTGSDPNAGAIQGPAIDVPSGSRGVQIGFEILRETEEGLTFDQSFIEARPLGAEIWTVLARLTDQRECGSSPQTITIGLGKKSIKPVLGTSFQHRFRFDTIDDIGNGGIGWYVDNVVVRTID